MIWFAIGNASTIPIMAIYVYYYPDNKEFGAALFICVLTSCMSIAIVPFCYSPVEGTAIAYKPIITPILHTWSWFATGTSWHYHCATDWLVVGWMSFWATLFSIVACLACFLWYIYKRDNRGMFDYSTSCFDFVLLLIGNIYILAGSYQFESEGGVGSMDREGTIPDPELGPMELKTGSSAAAADKLPEAGVVSVLANKPPPASSSATPTHQLETATQY